MNKLNLALILMLSASITVKGQVNTDSLEQVLKSAKDTVRINILNKLGDELTTVDYEKSLAYTAEALALSEKRNYAKGEADAQKTFGYIYLTKAEYPKAIEHSDKALALYTSLNDQENKGFIFNMLGVIYETLGVYDKALNYFLQAQKIYEQFGIERKMANVYSNISLIYLNQKRYELSLDYVRKALKIDLKNNDENGVAIDYTNIANTYFADKQYTKALQYRDSIIPILKKNQDYITLGSAYSLFGGIYYDLNNWQKAIELYQLSIETLTKVNDIRELLNSYVNLAQIYYDKKDLEKATLWGKKALELSVKVNRNYSFASVYKTLALIHKAKGEYKQALECQEKYVQYNDSLKKNELSQTLLNMQTLYETETKEQQINYLNKENNLKSNQLLRQQLIIALVVISLILSLLFLVFIFNRYKIKRNANKALEAKNNEIEAQKQQIVEINNKLSIQASELKNLDEIKSRFFTNISHEFRTPLTLIISPLEILLSKPSDETINSEYTIMLRQAKRLLSLVNQLLELSKLEKGLLHLSLTNDDVNRFVRVLTTSYSSLGYETNIEMTYEGPNNELIMWFDKDKVEKIVTNLITNAIKFTKPGGKVSVALSISPTNKHLVELTIKDTGMGIDAENLKYIFNPFYQASLSVNKKFQGTGIGLSLVKEMVVLHHGSISVHSQVGKGSEFIVQLPIDKSAYNEDEFIEVENEYNISNPEIFTKANIQSVENEVVLKTDKVKDILLLVEDNEDMRRHIAQNLMAEYQIVEAANGNEGLEKAFESLPDIILSDIMMPDMDGIELATILKKDERTSHIPIILLTAKASEKNKIEGLESRADDYITKPFSIHELSLRIQNLIFNRQKIREKFEKNISIIPSDIVTNSVDEQFLMKALHIVEIHIDDLEYNAEKFCKDMGMSRSNLHRKLIALTNQPVTEFIRTIRMKRAAQLLSNHTASVSEIAFKTGFGNLSYFTKCFKEQFGTTPSEYANQMKQK